MGMYRARKGQVAYGQAIGILMLDANTPFIPGDVGNATTYSFPVIYKVVPGLLTNRMLSGDPAMRDVMIQAGRELEAQGVRAITGDCGFMAYFQRELAAALNVPVFMSSLMQVPLMHRMLKPQQKVGIVTADSKALGPAVLGPAGVDPSVPIVVAGMQDQPAFRAGALEEQGFLDATAVEDEVVGVVKALVEADPEIGSILLECSMLPPYAAAVQEAVGLPVFDFVTFINYVFSALVRKRFDGFV